jgi:hypothetical protein
LNGTVPFCNSNKTISTFVSDCAELNCTCCTGCCPAVFGDIPVSDIC